VNNLDEGREQTSVIMPHTERDDEGEEVPRSRAASRTCSCWWNMHCIRVCIHRPNSCWERRKEVLYIGQASRSDDIPDALGTTSSSLLSCPNIRSFSTACAGKRLCPRQRALECLP
jgi:hypothetical protein